MDFFIFILVIVCIAALGDPGGDDHLLP